MTEIVKVADGIHRINIGRLNGAVSGEWLRCCLVFLIEDNGQTALVETSPGSVSPPILDAIREIGYEPSEISSIILTHIHLDHAGGVGKLAKLMPRAKVIVHQRGARHLSETAKLVEGTRLAYGENFEANYGPIVPVPAERVIAVEDGSVIKVGERELRVIYTPGHAPHHMCLYDEETQGLFSGDALGIHGPGEGSVVIVGGFDLDLAIESIDRLSALNPKVIYASHGTAEREVDEFILSVRTVTLDYGNIVLEVLKAGGNEDEMVRKLSAYQKVKNDNNPRLTEKPGNTDKYFREIVPWYEAHFKRKGIM